jgi:hypothetical protein
MIDLTNTLLGLPIPLHVIDVTQVDGLLDMIALGNIIEFAVVLDYRTHEGIELDDDEYLEREAAMAHYRTFMTWYSKHYGLLINDNWVNASYLVKQQLISFGAILGDYFSKAHSTVQRHDKLKGITPSSVKKIIRHHIQESWSSLLPAFDKLVTEPPSFLSYTGLPFCIFRLTLFRLEEENLLNNPLCTECLDYDPPIYITAEPTLEDLIPDHPAEKRTRFDTSAVQSAVSPPSSPSQQKDIKRRK